jgi:hypothetical protein
MTPREKAVELLMHYLDAAQDHVLPSDKSDFVSEMEELVDAIVDRALEVAVVGTAQSQDVDKAKRILEIPDWAKPRVALGIQAGLPEWLSWAIVESWWGFSDKRVRQALHCVARNWDIHKRREIAWAEDKLWPGGMGPL